MEKEYCDALIYQRKINNYSQNELSKNTGISQQNISYWESGKKDPSITHCIKLADFYGISLDELIGRDFIEQKSAPKYQIGTLNNNGKLEIK